MCSFVKSYSRSFAQHSCTDIYSRSFVSGIFTTCRENSIEYPVYFIVHDNDSATYNSVPVKADAGCGDVNAGCGDVNAGCGDVNAGYGDVNADCGDVNAGCGDVNADCGDVNADCGDVNAGCGDVSAGCGDVNADCGDVNANCVAGNRRLSGQTCAALDIA